MHPQGAGLKTLHKNQKEDILAPLREYKNKFKKGDVIIFSATIQKYKDYGKDWTKLYETFLQQTKDVGMKFILISPTPSFSGVNRGYTCQKEWYRPSWAISPLCFGQVNKSEWFASNDAPITLIEKFLLANPKVSYIDGFPILCPNTYCKNHDQLSLLYKDQSHLSSYGAMKLSNTIETVIRSK